MPFPIWPFKHIPFGRRSELDAADYLRSLGFKILASGFRTTRGEVDLIARDGDVLVFVEVKARRSYSSPEDAVNRRKRQRVVWAARSYIARYRLHDDPYRFDILAITSEHGPSEFRLIRDAFREESAGL